MAVKSAVGEDGFELWDAWSRGSAGYRAPDARTVWRSIDPDGEITLGTPFFEASRYGYVRGASGDARDHAIGPSAGVPTSPGGGGTIRGGHLPGVQFRTNPKQMGSAMHRYLAEGC